MPCYKSLTAAKLEVSAGVGPGGPLSMSVRHSVRGWPFAQLAAALSLKPIELPRSERLLGDDMPRPPYGFQDDHPSVLLTEALSEFREHVRQTAVSS